MIGFVGALAFALSGTVSGTIAITNVKIEVGDGTVIEQGTVVIEGGKIIALGASAAVPQGAERIDGTGKVVTPGLVATSSQAGLVEVSLERATVDTHMSGAAVPAFRAIDGFNPLTPRIPIEREQGVLTEILTPDGQLIYGQGFAVELSGTLGSTSAAKRVAMFGGFAESAKDAAGGSRGAVLLRLREIFDDVRFYKANKAAYDRAATRELALPRVHLEALIDVVDGKLPLVFDVNRASDIQALLVFAREQKIRVVIHGGAEAWLVAADLAKAQVPVIIEPSSMEPSSFAMLRERDDCAAVLQKAGVTVVLSSGRGELGTTRLRQEAGIAVSYGMTHAAALEAITRAPARVFGIDAEIGTLTVGKRANVVMWSGDPFETTTASELVLIGGEKMSLDTRHKQLVEKYRHLR